MIANAEANSELILAGAGGNVLVSGTGGAGGSSTATASATDGDLLGAGSATASGVAYGGDGGSSNLGNGGAGGVATASASARPDLVPSPPARMEAYMAARAEPAREAVFRARRAQREPSRGYPHLPGQGRSSSTPMRMGAGEVTAHRAQRAAMAQASPSAMSWPVRRRENSIYGRSRWVATAAIRTRQRRAAAARRRRWFPHPPAASRWSAPYYRTIGGNAGNGGGAATAAGGAATTTVNLTATENLTITAAGAGGNGASDGAGGAGGNAIVSATGSSSGTISGQSAESISAAAAGGIGGDAQSAGNAGNGGTATASASVSGSGPDGVTSHATATGGNGGSSHSTSHANGAGGAATATATGPGNAMLIAEAYGGIGGSKFNGSAAAGGAATAILHDNQYNVEQDSPAAGSAGGSAYLQLTPGTILPNVLNVGSSTGITNNTSLSVSGNGIATMYGLLGSGSLNISGNADFQLALDSGASQQSSLSISGGGTFDIYNNHFFLNYGSGPDPIVSIAALIKSGYDGDTWSGTGITSTEAHYTSSRYGIGYADSADKGNPAHLVSSGQIEIMYTLLGDANLDGIVSGDDFTILTDNLGKQVTSWDQGDFNYDGVVSGDDFTLLVGNLGKQANNADVTVPASDYAAIDAFAAAHGLMADVPEPGSCAMVMMAGGAMLARRRRRLN